MLPYFNIIKKSMLFIKALPQTYMLVNILIIADNRIILKVIQEQLSSSRGGNASGFAWNCARTLKLPL